MQALLEPLRGHTMSNCNLERNVDKEMENSLKEYIHKLRLNGGIINRMIWLVLHMVLLSIITEIFKEVWWVLGIRGEYMTKIMKNEEEKIQFSRYIYSWTSHLSNYRSIECFMLKIQQFLYMHAHWFQPTSSRDYEEKTRRLPIVARRVAL